MVVVLMRPRNKEGLRSSLVLSSGEEDRGEGVTMGVDGPRAVAKLRRARWTWTMRDIRAFSVSEDEEGDGEEEREEMKIGIEG